MSVAEKINQVKALEDKFVENTRVFTNAKTGAEQRKAEEKHQEYYKTLRELGKGDSKDLTLEEQESFREAYNQVYETAKEAFATIQSKEFKIYGTTRDMPLSGKDQIKAEAAKRKIYQMDGSPASEKAARDAISAIGYTPGRNGEPGVSDIDQNHPEILNLRKMYDNRAIETQQKVCQEILSNPDAESKDLNRVKELLENRIPEKIKKLGDNVKPELVQLQNTLEMAFKEFKK